MLLAAITAIAFGLTALWSTSRTGYYVIPDELVYNKQATHIARELAPLLPSDEWYVSFAQLGALLMAPFYALFSSTTAFTMIHVLQAGLMASAAIPAYLLCMRVTRSAPAALLVAALSVSVPWMVLSGTFLTEPLGYPAYAWGAWAIQRSIASPGPRNDALALAVIALASSARAQHLVLLPVMVAASLLHELGYARARAPELSWGRALRAAATRIPRSHPVLTGAAAVGALLLFSPLRPDSALGVYSGLRQGALLPTGAGAWSHELAVQLALGIGVMPVVMAAAWGALTLVRPLDRERHAFAAILVVALPASVLLAGLVEAKWLPAPVANELHDRYVFYVVPLVFVGMAALLSERRTATLPLSGAAIGVAALVSTAEFVGEEHVASPFSSKGGFRLSGGGERIGPLFSPGSGFGAKLDDFGDWLGGLFGALDPATSTVVASLTVVATVLLIAARRRWPGARVGAVVATLTLAYVLAATIEVGERAAADISPDAFVREITPYKGWPDRSVPDGARVALLASSATAPPPHERDALLYIAFWSERIDRVAHFEDAIVTSTAVVQPQVTIDPSTGAVSGFESWPYIVRPAVESRFRLRGERVVERRGALLLVQASRPYAATWTLEGAGIGGNLSTTPATLRVFRGPGAGARRVTIALQAPLETAAPITYSIRSKTRVARGTVGTFVKSRITIPVVPPGSSFEDLSILAPGASVIAVTVRPA